MDENIIKRIKDYFVEENIPENGFVSKLEEDTRCDDSDWEYAIINQVYVSSTYQISFQSGVKTEKVAYEIVYPDGHTDVITYPEFEEITDGHYTCPDCDSYTIMSENVLGGKIHCRECEWHNYNWVY